MIKSSIRYFMGKPVRAYWDLSKNEWRYAAVDLIMILTTSNAPRIYWNAVKRRNRVLESQTLQVKLTATDGKRYLTDTINTEGLRLLAHIIPSRHYPTLQKWISRLSDPLDTQSKDRAYELFNNELIPQSEVGTFTALSKIHAHLFAGLYDYAGQVRTKNIAKGGFTFASAKFLCESLKTIDAMPQQTFSDIVTKYVEMNIAHPFLEGNGRATRIWLDLLLRKELAQVVDWAKIAKKDYLTAMQESPYSSAKIFTLLQGALTTDINNRELFLKGIDYSYYYEEV